MPKVNGTYLSLIGTAFALGTLPAISTLAVDPYQMFFKVERPTAINDLAEKAHYPLWKLAKFKRGAHDTIILGDSRARALRDKYWHELKIPNALNLAYGGGTIPEIYSTFQEIKNDKAIKNLVIGIQLRSFDEDHKGGMNRVPEAVWLVRHKLEYLKNWNVFQTTMKVFEKENAENFDNLISKAHAADLGREGKTSLSKLLEPKVCFGCDLPTGLKPLEYAIKYKGYSLPSRYHYGGWGLGRSQYDWQAYSSLYNVATTLENLPQKFARQVRRNGKADWRGFEFSKKYWSYFEEISAWAKSRNKNLVFVIPPTITNMQGTIHANGLSQLNHALRVKLSGLGTVVDLDFPNKLTEDVAQFNDAYHFNSKVARQIVGQIVPLITDSKDAHRIAKKRASDMRCSGDIKSQKIADAVTLTSGENCRIWRTGT